MSTSTETAWGPTEMPPGPLRRFTIEEYHRMIETGVLGPEDRLELLNGWIVSRSPHNPPHDTSVSLTDDAIDYRLPQGWCIRVHASITLSESEPEPDIAVVRGEHRRYASRHPSPTDIGILVEVSESTLRYDREEKGPTYAREGIAVYWIVNLVETKIETYTDPSPTGYRQRRDYVVGESVPLMLDGREVATIPVEDLLP